MARRRKYQYITDPISKAAVVHSAFISKVKDPREREKMVKNYNEKLSKYPEQVAKQEFAVLKLAGFYMGLSKPEVKRAIREAVQSAKDVQTEIVSKAVEERKIPVVAPEEAESLAKKVSGIISAVIKEEATSSPIA